MKVLLKKGKKMKKLLKFIAWLFAILIVLVVVLYLTAGIWLRSVVSTFIPQITKTSASLEHADISLFSGKIVFKGFKIGNPPGISAPNAFEFGELSVKFQPRSIFSSKIIIDEIKIDGPKIDAELAKVNNMNLMVLNDNIQQYLGNSFPANPTTPPKQEAPKKEADSPSKTVLIKDLKLTNSLLKFAFLGNNQQIKLPDYQQKNIGADKKKEKSISEIVPDILAILTSYSLLEISKQGQQSMNQLLDSLAGRSKEAAGFVKGLKAEMQNLF